MTALADMAKAELGADGVPVGVGRKPADVGNRPWIVIWPDAGRRYAATMKATDGLSETWVCHCIGLTPEAAAVAVRKLTAAIYGLHGQVVGDRKVLFPEQTDVLPLSRDDDVDPPLYSHVVEWRFTTTPA